MATKASRAALAAASKIDASGNIEADTLDGVDSLQFTRSDQADTLNGDFTVSSSGAGGIILSQDIGNTSLSSRLFFTNGASGEGVTILNNAGAIKFYTGSIPGTTSGSEKVSIAPNGDFGIGVASPAFKLDVNGHIYTNSTLYAGGGLITSGSSSASVKLYGGGTYEGGTIQAVGGVAATDPGSLKFRTGTGTGEQALAMIINANGNVGIGTTDPLDKLEVNFSGSNPLSTFLTKGSNTKGLWVTTDNNNDDMVGLYMGSGGGTHFSAITSNRSNVSSHWGTHLSFYTHGDNTGDLSTATERMRLDGQGRLLVGRTSSFRGKVDAYGTSCVISAEGTGSGYTEGSYLGVAPNNYRGGGLFMYNRQGGGTPNEWFAGRIYTNASNYYICYKNNPTGPGEDTAQDANKKFLLYQNGNYWFAGSNSSDERLKSNIQLEVHGLNSVLSLKPKTFVFTPKDNEDADLPVDVDDNPKIKHGLIAQDVLNIIPTLVTGDPDNPDEYLGVDYLGLTSVLVKAVQEQQEIIEELKARIEAAGL